MAGLLDMLGLGQQRPQMPQQAPAAPDPYAGMVQSMKQQYPLIQNIPITVGRGQGPYQSEVYMPWNKENPTPNQFHIELRHYLDQPRSDTDVRNLLTGEMFHYLGTKNPQGQPVSPDWYNLKQQAIANLPPNDLANAHRNWQQAQAHGDKRSFNDWMQESNMDQYIGGVMNPLSNETEWVNRAKNLPKYGPKEAQTIEQMRQLLTTGKIPQP